MIYPENLTAEVVAFSVRHGEVSNDPLEAAALVREYGRQQVAAISKAMKALMDANDDLVKKIMKLKNQEP